MLLSATLYHHGPCHCDCYLFFMSKFLWQQLCVSWSVLSTHSQWVSEWVWVPLQQSHFTHCNLVLYWGAKRTLGFTHYRVLTPAVRGTVSTPASSLPGLQESA